MPLSSSAARSQIYARNIKCRAFLRHDGLWDIEGLLEDQREFESVAQTRGVVSAGQNYHQMATRLTIDNEMVIHAIEVVLEMAPYDVCPNVSKNYDSLLGLSLKSKFLSTVRDRIGDAGACTHIRELLSVMTTTAFQALVNFRRHQSGVEEAGARDRLLDTCYALSRSSPVVKIRWPEAHRHEK